MYTLQPHATCRETGSKLRMLFDREKGVMYELNETASAIVGLLAESPRSQSDLVEAMLTLFHGPRDEVSRDVAAFLEDFVRAGVVSQTGASS